MKLEGAAASRRLCEAIRMLARYGKKSGEYLRASNALSSVEWSALLDMARRMGLEVA